MNTRKNIAKKAIRLLEIQHEQHELIRARAYRPGLGGDGASGIAYANDPQAIGWQELHDEKMAIVKIMRAVSGA
jgi:hypothetical protein